jgi:hypothetical protein
VLPTTSVGPPRSRDELGAELIRTRALINRLELRFARIAARFAEASDLDLHDDPASWIRQECRMTSHAAFTALQVGATESQLPASIGALLERRIGLAHLGLMAQTAEFAARCPVPQTFDELTLLPAAERGSVTRIRTACYHAEHKMHAAACVASAAVDVDWRRLRLRSGEGGCVTISGCLDAEGAGLLRTALEPLARKSGPDEYRGRAQRLADALVELAAHRLDLGQIPARASQRSHLQVTATLETLCGLAGAPAGELDGGATIPDATVQRLACDATITRVLLNAESAVIDVGRSQRVVPGSTRRALNVRDKGCRWPGCDRPASWTAAHHIIHWTHGGMTDLDNLVLLCHRHHWLVHECGFQIVRTDGDGILTIPPPPDHAFRTRPPTVAAAA